MKFEKHIDEFGNISEFPDIFINNFTLSTKQEEESDEHEDKENFNDISEHDNFGENENVNN